MLSLDKEVENLNLDKVTLELVGLMHQHDSNALIHEEKQRLNRLEKEEVVPRYRSTSPPYYRQEHEDEELEKITKNFEPQIHYVVEQKATTQGIKMSK